MKKLISGFLLNLKWNYFPNFNLLKRWPLLEWIWLYYFIKNKSEPLISISDYSNTLQDAVSMPFNYGFNTNPILIKMLGHLMSDIEYIHRYGFDHNHKPECLLDCSSWRNREKLGREKEDKLVYYIRKQVNETGEDKILYGPITNTLFALSTVATTRKEARNKSKFDDYYIITKKVVDNEQ